MPHSRIQSLARPKQARRALACLALITVLCIPAARSMATDDPQPSQGMLSMNTQAIRSARLSVDDWAFTLGGRLQVNF